MKKSIVPFTVLLCVSCSEQSQDIQLNQESFSSAGQGLNEIHADYGNATIHFDEEKSGDESFIIQEISHEKEDVIFRMKKIPTALYLKKENSKMSDSTLTEALGELSGEQIFYFEIEEKTRKDIMKKYHESDFDKAVSYFSFEIQKDFSLYTSGGDTLKPSFTIYERNFHLAPFERIIIDFNGLKNDQAFELVYKDQMFGKGEVTFSFPDEKFVSTNVKELL